MSLLLAFALASSIGSEPPGRAPEKDVVVQCAMGRSFRFTQTRDAALIDYEGRRIILARRELPVGTYFRSKDGALIIDGKFVAFVPRGDETWRDCRLMP
ncbi:hypothetical protein JQK15_21095 [Sphingobium sp. BHU LFT2]|nr:hypothetical protein [Sphingobium sp. BHU LFT2]MBT2246012.1 hypothetical protein [Sphingobium sp. BHU LFT2]